MPGIGKKPAEGEQCVCSAGKVRVNRRRDKFHGGMLSKPSSSKKCSTLHLCEPTVMESRHAGKDNQAMFESAS